jgi:ribulose-phosphate 3-epimerase
MVKISPSLLACDFSRLADEIAAVQRGGAGSIHLDVMDGRFVPNITFGPVLVAAARRHASVPLVAHLMIESPERYVDAFVQAGAGTVTVHQEACIHLHRVVEQIRHTGARAGVAINPATPLCAVEEVLPYVDVILIMTVNPGFGGQEFIRTMPDKVARLSAMLAERGVEAEIEVDGGIGATTIPDVVKAGAQVLVAGAAVFGAPRGAEAAVRELRAIAEAAEKTKGQPETAGHIR